MYSVFTFITAWDTLAVIVKNFIGYQGSFFNSLEEVPMYAEYL